MNATHPTHAAEQKGKQTEGHNTSGGFAPGNPGGPGNPFARKVAALRKALIEAVTEEDVREIAKVLIEKAKEGSTAAIKLIFQYAIGKPGPETDPDRLDLDGWQLLPEAARPGAVATLRDGTPHAGGKSALPSSVPAGLVDRLALAGLGTAHVPVSVAGPSANGEIGARETREGKPR